MDQSRALIECARAIRPHLGHLIGPDANMLDQRLAALIVRAQGGEDVEDTLYDLLAQREKTKEWMEKYLAGKEEGIAKGFDPLYGNPNPVIAQRYKCPKGDFPWTRRSAGQAIPLCPVHQIPLEPV